MTPLRPPTALPRPAVRLSAGIRGPLALAGLLAGYVLLAGRVPPADDELYYWCWAQSLQLSYFDHPGLSAYLIRAATAAFGDSLTATRLPACLASVAVFAVIARLSRPATLLPWVAFTPLFTFGAVLVTPDTPLLLFWALYLVWLLAVHERLTPQHSPERERRADQTPVAPAPGCDGTVPGWLWLVGGVVLGCGALGKYTMALAVPAGFVSFLLARGAPWRAWLPGYVGHGVVSAVIVTPILVFNWQHDFAPILFQLKHASQTAPERGWLPFWEFAGVQVLLFGVLPLALLPWAVWNVRTLAADPRLRVCLALYAVPLTFFLYKAAKGPLEGNWGLICYVGFWPLAAQWYAAVCTTPLRRAVALSTFAVPAGCVLLLAVHLVRPLPQLEPHRDRITRQAARVEVARRAAEAATAHGAGLPAFTGSYQWTALLRFHGLPAHQIPGATRPSNFTLTDPTRLADFDRVYVFSEGPLPAAQAPGYELAEIVANLPLAVRGQTITCYQLLVYRRTGR